MNFTEHARTIATLAILSMSLLWSGAATAQPDMAQMLQQRFKAADTNHDGRLSKTEADSGMPRVAQHFDELTHPTPGPLHFSKSSTSPASNKADNHSIGQRIRQCQY